MRKYRVNKNLKVTIPHRLRKKFEIEKGTKVYFIEEKDGIKVIPSASKRVKAEKLSFV